MGVERAALLILVTALLALLWRPAGRGPWSRAGFVLGVWLAAVRGPGPWAGSAETAAHTESERRWQGGRVEAGRLGALLNRLCLLALWALAVVIITGRG
jgi:hypothetical protein